MVRIMTKNELAAVHVCLGRYGNGQERRAKLTAAGYDPDRVQTIVNGIMTGDLEVSKAPEIHPLVVTMDLNKYNALEVIFDDH